MAIYYFSLGQDGEFLMLPLFSLALGHFVNMPFCLPTEIRQLCEERQVQFRLGWGISNVPTVFRGAWSFCQLTIFLPTEIRQLCEVRQARQNVILVQASKEEFLMLSLFSVALGHFVNFPFCLPTGIRQLCEVREARQYVILVQAMKGNFLHCHCFLWLLVILSTLHFFYQQK